ncbi:hypothetical protein CSOJ01_15590 [Colletotrichum sojae]|uniref:Uncharacterized protein n=1 Tax=Colletotrichum sojae TaxID=2175907 RepID=A0A8H6MIJ3_9PEZI|nr:hypothetical protein CSOJ01_15590 [Colletotrichum sojae]
MLGILPLAVIGLASTVMAESQKTDWNQCYYAKDAVAPPDLLPCLDESKADGASWCCFAGHSCVKQACWDKETAVTYQYGCNDPTYEHKNCPPKGGLDMGKSPWVGLVICNDTHNEGIQKFWACNHPDTCGDYCPGEARNPQVTQTTWPWTIQGMPPLSYCDDLGSRVLAMSAPTTLAATGSVPEVATGTNGKPTPTRMPMRSEAVKTSVSVTMVVPVETASPTIGTAPTPTSSNRSDEGAVALSLGAIAGIAVGSTLGVVAVIAGILFMWRQRRKAAQGHVHDSTPPAAPLMGTGASAFDEKRNLMVPGTPSFFSSRAGVHRPQSVISSGAPTPSPMGTPNTPVSPCYAQHPHTTHAELSDEARVIYEMPAMNERCEAP